MKRIMLAILVLSACAPDQLSEAPAHAEAPGWEEVKELYIRNDADIDIAGALTVTAITKLTGPTERTDTHQLYVPFADIRKGAPKQLVISTLEADRVVIVGDRVQKTVFTLKGVKAAVLGGLAVSRNYEARLEKAGKDNFSAQQAQTIVLKKKGTERIGDDLPVPVPASSCAPQELATELDVVADGACGPCMICEVSPEYGR